MAKLKLEIITRDKRVKFDPIAEIADYTEYLLDLIDELIKSDDSQLQITIDLVNEEIAEVLSISVGDVAESKDKMG